jgi:glycine/D-amino acid oxidase-like deaminating enzyme
MYDPLVDLTPPSHFQYPDSFWVHPQSLVQYPRLRQAVHTDVAIIGGGYTGLSCALHLAERFDIDCTVVEANQPGWGCSGRNGGFVLPGTGRLSIEQITGKWGEKVGKAVYKEYLSSIALVSELIGQGIDCEQALGGYLKLAHTSSLVEPLHQQAKMLSDEHGDSIVPLTASDINARFVSGTQAFGGIFYPNAFGVNPWLLCQGIASRAKMRGAAIYGHSAVTQFERAGDRHLIHTAGGSIIAKTLILATNAYGQRNLSTSLKDKMFPVISIIIVTQPLNQVQLKAIGMRPGLMVMDTRPLKYYYRLLPDNRLLFGGRGAINGADASKDKYRMALQSGLQQTFPSLTDVVAEQFWSGWVSVSLDDYPRVYHDQINNTLYSGGYCGAGLAFSIQAGKRLAQMLVEPNSLPDLPYWQSPLKHFPMASLRRPALQGFYAWQALKRSVGL